MSPQKRVKAPKVGWINPVFDRYTAEQHWHSFQEMLQTGRATGYPATAVHLAAIAQSAGEFYSADSDFVPD